MIGVGERRGEERQRRIIKNIAPTIEGSGARFRVDLRFTSRRRKTSPAIFINARHRLEFSTLQSATSLLAFSRLLSSAKRVLRIFAGGYQDLRPRSPRTLPPLVTSVFQARSVPSSVMTRDSFRLANRSARLSARATPAGFASPENRGKSRQGVAERPNFSRVRSSR